MRIHTAVGQGDKDAVLRELESGVPLDALDDDGRTPLTVATIGEESRVEIMQLLLDRGADPNIVPGAVGTGDIARVRCLLDAGADVNLTDDGCLDALACAVSEIARTNDQSTLLMVELLLEHGASLDFDDSGQTALSTAFDNGHFEVVKRLLEAGADESQLEWTSLMRAITIGTVDDVREQLEQGASLTERDGVGERTPWLLALSGGDIEKVKLLLATGAQLEDVGWYKKTTLMYPIEANNPEMLQWLLSIGCNIDAANEDGETALMKAAQEDSVLFVQMLLEAGADPDKDHSYRHKAIGQTSSMEVVRLLLAVGQDLNDISSHTRAALLGIEDESPLSCSREDFETGRLPRLGTANPERMDLPFWKAMVQSGVSAYAARAAFVPEDEMYTESEMEYPVWCYNRFGKSINELPDGRFIEIGGEHEDSYDRDFCIYNDVFVHRSQGQFDIYGYPREVFPPTNFHSATFVDGFIYIIGCLGYPEQRVVGHTPVYRLNTETLAIESVETSGENPGWIYKHKAVLKGNEIHIAGGDVWNGPDSPEESERKAAERAKMMAFPAKEDFASDGEWVEAVGQHLGENRIEEYERPERFVLNLDSLQWRRLVE